MVEWDYCGAILDDCLSAHNSRRILHKTSAITWDSELEAIALIRAKISSDNQMLVSDPNTTYGENIFKLCVDELLPCDTAVVEWYDYFFLILKKYLKLWRLFLYWCCNTL